MTLLQRSGPPQFNARIRSKLRDRATRVMVSLLAAIALVGGLGFSAPAQTDAQGAAPTWAYVWADDYTATETYTPNTNYQFNSTGGENTITRSDVGVYTVTLPGISKDAHSQLTTISENGELCKVVSSKGIQGASEHVVQCFAADDTPVDIGFQFIAMSGGSPAPSAYVWANDSASESYTPNESYQFNSTGELNTIARTDVGTYTVDLPGQGAESGTFQVTAMSTTSTNAAVGVSCAVRRWAIGDANLKSVEVNCFDSTGARVDSGFGLMYFDGMDTAASGQAVTGAYLLLNHSSADGRFTPGMDFQFNSSGGQSESERNGVGSYSVYLQGMAAEAGSVQVSAWGADPGMSCSVANWALDGDAFVVNVLCFDLAGNPANSFFMLLYTNMASAG